MFNYQFMKNLLVLVYILTVVFTAKSQDYVITRFSVSTDSTKLNTRAIQNIIDSANENGGGTIVIPKGVFLTGALFFKPNTKLHLQEGAVLKGSDDISDYPLIPSRMEGKNLLYYAALINAYYVNSFRITGPGTINGNGLRFWKSFWDHRDSMRKIGKSSTNLEVHRPRLIFIWGSNDVTIRDVKLRDAGFWTTHLYQCNNVLIENCDIRSPYKPVPAPSTDGVDIDVCKKVTIRNCYISVNDDAIAIKGGKGPYAHKQSQNGIVEDILIENCIFGQSHGTLTLGSECMHARNITVRNCKVDNNCAILRMKMRPDTYQIYENITIENITGRSGPIISMNPWKQFFSLEGSSEKPYGIVRNITFSNINVKCKAPGEIQGNPADSVSNIVFRNINATADTDTLKSMYQNIKADNVIINGKPLVIK
jgi:polygalacturonase